jgi:hypothetical protein
MQHVNEVMTQLSDQFEQDWLAELNKPGSGRGNVGNLSISTEHYLTCVLQAKHQIALTKLRVSSHHLAIEVGRYHKLSALHVGRSNATE